MNVQDRIERLTCEAKKTHDPVTLRAIATELDDLGAVDRARVVWGLCYQAEARHACENDWKRVNG